MKKLFTSLLLGASLLTFGRQGGINYDWSGMINTSQHMNTSRITSDNNGNLFVGTWNLKGNADLDIGAGVSSVNFGSVNGSAIISYKSDKSFRWAKAFTTESRVTDVVVAQNGEIIVTGAFQGSLVSGGETHLTGTAGKWNGFVVKLDANGEYINGRSLNAGDNTWIRGVEVDASGNIYITGESIAKISLNPFDLDPSTTTTSAANAGFTVKYNSSFSYQWGVENYSTAEVFNRSITQDDNFIYVAGDHNAGTINVASVAGQSVFTQTSTKTSGHVVMINKSDGTAVHLENVAASETNGTCRVRDIEIAKDGNVMIAGGYIAKITIDNQVIGGNASHQRGFITKFNTDVNNTADELAHNWTNIIYDGSESQYSNPIFDIGISPIDGSIYAARGVRFGAKMRLFKNGNTQDEVTIYSSSTNTNTDAHGVYLDKDANLIDYTRFGNTSVSLAVNAHITNDGSLLLGGWFRASTDFDPSSASATLNGGNFNSIFLSKLNLIKPSTRIYVNATKSGDGTSWGNAYSSIDNAFSVAETGDTILVAAGTYGALTANKDVKLWGGYASAEPNKRDLKANPTIIDAKSSSLHAVTISSNNLVMDGFVVTGGAQLNSSSDANKVSGAGLFYNITSGDGELVIKNCEIKDNKGWTQGAGLYVNVAGTGTFNVKIENTHIHGNSSRYAQSWYSRSNGTTTLNVDFVNNLVNGNFSKNHNATWTGWKAGGGGMISGFDNSTLNVNIINSTITKNTYQGTETGAGDALIAASQTKANSPNVSLFIYNSILHGNESTNPIGYWENGTSYEKINNLVMRNNITDVTVANNYAQLNTSITNNMNDDPLFTDATNNDFTLATNSPAIDAGDTSGISSMIPIADLAWNNRIAGTKIDLGAYEANSTAVVSTFGNEEVSSINVYPNPANNVINIDADVELVTITNTNGQVVATSTESSIDVSDLATGLYIVHIQTENGIYSAKITKQ